MTTAFSMVNVRARVCVYDGVDVGVHVCRFMLASFVVQMIGPMVTGGHPPTP